MYALVCVREKQNEFLYPTVSSSFRTLREGLLNNILLQNNCIILCKSTNCTSVFICLYMKVPITALQFPQDNLITNFITISYTCIMHALYVCSYSVFSRVL